MASSGRLMLVILGVLAATIQIFRVDTTRVLHSLRALQEQGKPQQQGQQDPERNATRLRERQQEKGSLSMQQTKRTAVVWTTVGITTDCEAARVRHLVETAGMGMDVWVLHSHHVLATQGRHEEVETSRRNIASIPGLQQASQRDIPFLPFDELAGTSKSSFLQFLAEHSKYEHGWIMENDMFYTGPWKDLFESTMRNDNRTDFLTSKFHLQKDNDWYWFTQQECKIFGIDCTEMDPQSLQVHWMFARISTRFAKAFLKDLYHGHIQGMHEAVVGGYCRKRGFSLATINQTRMGDISVGHYGTMKDEDYDVASRNPVPGKLVHPVKCAAYEDNTVTMERDIEKWARNNKGFGRAFVSFDRL